MAKLMAMADGRIDESEMGMIANEARRFGVSSSELKTILEIGDSMQASEAASILSSMDKNMKKYVCAYLGTMIAIDGDVDEAEVKMWSLISAMCDLPSMKISEAINIMADL
ncbi:MAG: TerB family tellurite resistance protein [Bacteroidales bacterium]|nr:TerB family tellurite resistance protein [Bacteroidales bacterium]